MTKVAPDTWRNARHAAVIMLFSFILLDIRTVSIIIERNSKHYLNHNKEFSRFEFFNKLAYYCIQMWHKSFLVLPTESSTGGFSEHLQKSLIKCRPVKVETEK